MRKNAEFLALCVDLTEVNTAEHKGTVVRLGIFPYKGDQTETKEEVAKDMEVIGIVFPENAKTSELIQMFEQTAATLRSLFVDGVAPAMEVVIDSPQQEKRTLSKVELAQELEKLLQK